MIKFQESVYLDEEDRKAEGYAGMVSANMNGLQSIKAVVSTFLHHPVFGNISNDKILNSFLRRQPHKKIV